MQKMSSLILDHTEVMCQAISNDSTHVLPSMTLHPEYQYGRRRPSWIIQNAHFEPRISFLCLSYII